MENEKELLEQLSLNQLLDIIDQQTNILVIHAGRFSASIAREGRQVFSIKPTRSMQKKYHIANAPMFGGRM